MSAGERLADSQELSSSYAQAARASRAAELSWQERHAGGPSVLSCLDAAGASDPRPGRTKTRHETCTATGCCCVHVAASSSDFLSLGTMTSSTAVRGWATIPTAGDVGSLSLATARAPRPLRSLERRSTHEPRPEGGVGTGCSFVRALWLRASCMQPGRALPGAAVRRAKKAEPHPEQPAAHSKDVTGRRPGGTRADCVVLEVMWCLVIVRARPLLFYRM